MEYEQLPGCCGAYVISEFDDLTDTYNKAESDGMIADFHDTLRICPDGKLIMAVLIDSQLRDGWLSVIQKAGFRRVSRWVNNNHGNVCNLFTMYKGTAVAPPYKGRKGRK